MPWNGEDLFVSFAVTPLDVCVVVCGLPAVVKVNDVAFCNEHFFDGLRDAAERVVVERSDGTAEDVQRLLRTVGLCIMDAREVVERVQRRMEEGPPDDPPVDE